MKNILFIVMLFGLGITHSFAQLTAIAGNDTISCEGDGNLIYTGKDLAVSPQITEKYKLEVIADADGFKDYDEIIVEVKDQYIDNISPNPASSNVVVNYKIDNTTSAYIMVLNATATTNSNYIVDVNQTQTTFNVSNFQQGSYSVILVCDGVAVDMKTLIVQ